MKSSIIPEILSYLATGISTAIAGGTFIHFKAKRKTETQKARQEENVADFGRFDNLQKLVTYQGKLLDQFMYTQQVQEKKLRGMQRVLSTAIGNKKYAEQHICLDLSCLERVPKFGSYTTVEEKLEENLDVEYNDKEKES